MSIVHLHLILNHVPVIGMFFVLLILAVAMWRRDSAGGKLGLSVLVGLAMITGLVFLTGEPAEEAVEDVAGVSERMIHPHEEAAEVALIATLVVGGAALVALVALRRKPLPRWAMGSALVAVVVVSGLLGWTANLGGQIRHAEIGTTAPPVGDDDDDRDH